MQKIISEIAREALGTEPGSFRLIEAGHPARSILIVRGEDGVARGFVNQCRHRGARLVTEPSGCRRFFTCPYHAWSYDSRGRLRSLPRAECFPGLDKEHYALQELSQ